jgi:hypothetical protein
VDSLDGCPIAAALEGHEKWVDAQTQEGKKLCENIITSRNALGTKLQACGSAFQNPDVQQHCTFRGIQEAIDAHNMAMSRHASWRLRLSSEYRRVSARIYKAAVHLLDVRTQHSLLLDQLRAAHEDALRIVKLGSSPDKDALEKIKLAVTVLSAADEKLMDAHHHFDKDKKFNRDNTNSKQALQKAKQEVLKQERQLEGIWADIRSISLLAYPDLPARAIELTQKESNHSYLRFLGHVDAASARLLAPGRSLKMYDDCTPISSASRQQSRHDVYRAMYDGHTVCLKKFDLGLVGDMLGQNVRKFQRELNSVSRLVHDHLSKAHLVFFEMDDYNQLIAYVQYSYCPLGDMGAWIQTTKPQSVQIQIVLLDSLRGLEYCKLPAFTHDKKHLHVKAIDSAKNIENRYQMKVHFKFSCNVQNHERVEAH